MIIFLPKWMIFIACLPTVALMAIVAARLIGYVWLQMVDTWARVFHLHRPLVWFLRNREWLIAEHADRLEKARWKGDE